MTVSELIAGLLAKLAGLGVAAKAALGAGLLTASVATAGAAGVLPEPVQHAVADVVNAATPLQIPDPGSVSKVVVSEDPPDGSTTTSTVPGDDDDDGATGAGAGATNADNHGACVSAVARDKTAQVGGNHGKAVSAAARSDCGKHSDDDTTT
jgi:hypothetical protein